MGVAPDHPILVLIFSIIKSSSELGVARPIKETPRALHSHDDMTFIQIFPAIKYSKNLHSVGFFFISNGIHSLVIFHSFFFFFNGKNHHV